MGLFGNKQSAQPAVEAPAVDEILTEEFREELRELCRTRLRNVIDESASGLQQEIAEGMKQVSGNLQQYMKAQMDTVIRNIHTEITSELQTRISEYNRTSEEAQQQASQSLTRTAQAVQEKYQQLSATLQQTISSQEVMMVAAFQDNKNRMATIEKEQYKALTAMQDVAENSRRESEALHRNIEKAAYEQEQEVSRAYQDNLARIKAAGDAQTTALQLFEQSAQTLQAQQKSLGDFLEQSVAAQKAMLIDSINDNMARILEHYLIESLGEQSDIRTQLPSILKNMETHKQAMKDDMSL